MTVLRHRYGSGSLALVVLILFGIYWRLSAHTSQIPVTVTALQWEGTTEIINEAPFLRDASNPGHVVLDRNRATDIHDSFQNYTRHADCNISSLDLHEPFHPLCSSKQSLLDAMSGGGRSGIDMPYIPRVCDMHWSNPSEICSLLSNFSHIAVVGDSMMREVANAMITFLRRDLSNGTMKNWIAPGRLDCRCGKIFDERECLYSGATSTSEVWFYDAESMWCSRKEMASIKYYRLLAYPLESLDLSRLTSSLPKENPGKPIAFIFGHGLHNDVNETASLLWLEQIQQAIAASRPWLADADSSNPRLFITPSSAGVQKPDQYIATQGNVALARFEKALGPAVRERGYDHLGTFNLTIQNTSPDGTHAGFRSNLIKAMMVFNWLSGVGAEG